MQPKPTQFRRLCVFCGSSKGARDIYIHAAQELGHELAKRRIELVYGGGNVGLMGVIADAVLAGGGHVIGVIPEQLMARELGHTGIQDLRIVKNMHERKAMMAELADGFIALPGGIGTYEEYFEVLTWAKLGIHEKPCALLNVDGFYNPVLSLLSHAVEEAFIGSAHRDMVLVEEDPTRLLEAMAAHRPSHLHKRIDKDKV